jgi:imidazoleglycerol phosphate dehydratase HisB
VGQIGWPNVRQIGWPTTVAHHLTEDTAIPLGL